MCSTVQERITCGRNTIVKLAERIPFPKIVFRHFLHISLFEQSDINLTFTVAMVTKMANIIG